MKIVHVVESLDVGGLEKVVVSLAAWQQGRGDTSRIVCLFHEGALSVQARAAGVPVCAAGKSAGLDLRALRFLRGALIESGAEVIHTHNPVAHYYAAAAALGLGARIIVNTRHGMGSAHESRRLSLLYRCASLGTAKIASVCHAAKDRFVNARVVPRDKAVVVPNGVATDRIAPRDPSSKARLLRQLGRPADTLLVGIVGRLNAVKDHATLLHAVRRLRHSGRLVDLLIVGDGELRSALEAQAAELQLGHCVHFTGMRDDVASLLAALDIFVLTSLSEGYSLALVEAATAALPIVATRVGGNAEIVEHDVTGLLVPAGDASAVAAALGRLFDDAGLRASMGERGRRWALQNGSIHSMGHAYRSLYDGEVRGGPSMQAGEAPIAGLRSDP